MDRHVLRQKVQQKQNTAVGSFCCKFLPSTKNPSNSNSIFMINEKSLADIFSGFGNQYGKTGDTTKSKIVCKFEKNKFQLP